MVDTPPQLDLMDFSLRKFHGGDRMRKWSLIDTYCVY